MGLFGNLFGGGGRTREQLAALLKEREGPLEALPVRYKAFTIPKRSGGARTIHAPDPALKKFQRTILRVLLEPLKPHGAAMGFRSGLSIVDHARRHAGAAVLVKLDIADFFPSTKAERIDRFFKALGWDAGARTWLLRWTTWEGGLPQGAPTSPALSNLVNLRLDTRLDALAAAFGGKYSRYADDLAFSFADAGKPIDSLVWTARRILADEGYRVQELKRVRVMRANRRQSVCGLVVNSGTPRLPRERRRWLRAVRHRMGKDGKSTLTPLQFAGWKSFASMVERKIDAAT